MAGEIITIRHDVDSLKEKYHNAIKNENIYDAMLMYNRLREYEFSDVNLRQAVLYSMLNSYDTEIRYLLKVVSDLSFVNYNPVSVLMRLGVYFNIYGDMDTFDFYKELLLLKHPGDINLLNVHSPTGQKYQRRIHLVEEESKFIYGDAMDLMGQGDPQEAINKLSSIPKGDPMYTKAQSLASVIYLSTGEVDKSKEIIMQLIEEENCNAEIINNVYRFTGFTTEEREKLILNLDNIKNSSNAYEVSMLKAELLMEEGKYQLAIDELKTIKSYLRFTEPCLKQLAIGYLNVEDFENLYEVLKQIYTIYPDNIGARYLALQIENGEKSLNYRYIFGALDRSMRKDLIKVLKSELGENKSLSSLSVEQVEFLFNIAKEVNDYCLMKKITRRIFHSKYSFLIQEALLDPSIANENQQLIFQVLVEEQSAKPWTFLVFGRIETIELDIPTLFKSNIILDKEKFAYLLTVFAQTYSLLYYIGEDIYTIGAEMNDLLSNIYTTPLDNEFTILRNAHYLVYMLVKYMCPEENLFEHTFNDITQEEKNTLNTLLEKLIKKEI